MLHWPGLTHKNRHTMAEQRIYYRLDVVSTNAHLRRNDFILHQINIGSLNASRGNCRRFTFSVFGYKSNWPRWFLNANKMSAQWQWQHQFFVARCRWCEVLCIAEHHSVHFEGHSSFHIVKHHQSLSGFCIFSPLLRRTQQTLILFINFS